MVSKKHGKQFDNGPYKTSTIIFLRVLNEKFFDDTLSEVWIIDSPIVLLYCICGVLIIRSRPLLKQRIENILDINIISAILKSHDINIISNISINHPRYSRSSKEIKSYSLQVSSLLTSLRYSKLVVRCGLGFLHFVPHL